MGLGPPRHRVIARLAEHHMTAKAKAGVKALLAEGESLADCSTWADEHRRDIREIAPWHYVDVPLNEPKYNARFSAPDAKHGSIVDKIREFKATRKDTTRSVEARRFALRFLRHLVEDVRVYRYLISLCMQQTVLQPALYRTTPHKRLVPFVSRRRACHAHEANADDSNSYHGRKSSKT